MADPMKPGGESPGFLTGSTVRQIVIPDAEAVPFLEHVEIPDTEAVPFFGTFIYSFV